MKTVAIAFLFMLLLSSPIHASVHSANDKAGLSIAQAITPLTPPADPVADAGGKTDTPIVIILGDGGEVYFFFMDQLFSLRSSNEADLSSMALHGESYN